MVFLVILSMSTMYVLDLVTIYKAEYIVSSMVSKQLIWTLYASYVKHKNFIHMALKFCQYFTQKMFALVCSIHYNKRIIHTYVYINF